VRSAAAELMARRSAHREILVAQSAMNPMRSGPSRLPAAGSDGVAGYPPRWPWPGAAWDDPTSNIAHARADRAFPVRPRAGQIPARKPRLRAGIAALASTDCALETAITNGTNRGAIAHRPYQRLETSCRLPKPLRGAAAQAGLLKAQTQLAVSETQRSYRWIGPTANLNQRVADGLDTPLRRRRHKRRDLPFTLDDLLGRAPFGAELERDRTWWSEATGGELARKDVYPDTLSAVFNRAVWRRCGSCA